MITTEFCPRRNGGPRAERSREDLLMPEPPPDPDPVRTRPFPSRPPRYDGKEREYLGQALDRGELFYWQQDGFTDRFLQRTCTVFGARHAVAVSSGTAALHAAVGGLGVRPGAEVVTSPITDMGTAIPILSQNAVPVFADVDPRTYNITADTIEAVVTDRTEAVIVVHLAGTPADLDPIVALGRDRGLPIIEDVAQSYGCTYRGRHAGTFGACGCFSLNTYKHLSCGDGGFLITDNEELYQTCHNFADKWYDRHGRGVRLSRMGMNYRMTELQAAVALAQLDRLDTITGIRNALGTRLTSSLETVPGILPPVVPHGGSSSYWFYMFRIDPSRLGMTRDAFADRLHKEGVPAGAGYIPRPLYRESVFLEKNFYPGGCWPAESITGCVYDYASISCTLAEEVLDSAILLPLHEGLSPGDIDDYAAAVRKVAGLASASHAGRAPA
jgi:dTDP-4-amino-4,6-dideoxygalactose transaminase